ncbi:MAG: ATPase P [Deltaproteobacteria bacterium]|jgi:soluble P-type ATPase|nr:ATPase P [Deltaproteobacteria bacterium]
MLQIDVPGQSQALVLEHLILDYNGTMAVDGVLNQDIRPALNSLAQKLTIHVVTADTFGAAEANLSGLDVKFVKLTNRRQAEAKLDYLIALGAQKSVCIGNGRNDRLMIKTARLGIAVIGPEGACGKSVSNADVVVSDIASALNLLLNPLRLTATLRD